MRIPFRGPKKRIKSPPFVEKWRELQQLCSNKDTWPQALINADKLLDRALKKKHFKGKTPGERLMNAQRFIQDNDDIWFAHNFVKKMVENPDKVKLKQADVKDVLMSFREALKDLGALPSAESKDA